MSLIDTYLSSKPSKVRKPNVIYVTAICKACSRQAVMDILNPPKYPLETLRIFESGNIIEDWFIEILKKSGEYQVIGTQTYARWYCDWGEIHGRVDALAQRKGGSLVLFEVKSIKNFEYLEQYKHDHHIQLNFYLNVLNVNFGEVYYINKEAMLTGKGEIDRRFIVEKDPEMFARSVKVAGDLYKYAVSKEIPCGTPGEHCKICQHFDSCPDRSQYVSTPSSATL